MISILTGLIGIGVSIVILLLIRKDQMHVRHGLGWILVAIGFSFLGFAPAVIDSLASYIGVSYPPILAVTLGMAVLIIKILSMDLERSRIEITNQRLVQRIAILETRITVVESSGSTQ